MIKGVQRSFTAVEGTYRHFQTVNLILTHFRREADRHKIYELVEKNASLKDFLTAAIAIHLYHNVGIKVEHDLKEGLTTEDSTKSLEIKEKAILFEEVSKLSKGSLKSEIDLLQRIIKRENRFITYCIKERDYKRYKERDVKEIEEEIEIELLEIIRKEYPPFFFYDLLSDTMGLTDKLKNKILEESSKLKDISIDLDTKLERKEKEDKFIETSTLLRSISQIQEKFEFKSYKELQIEEMPLNKIKRKILNHYFNHFPISFKGLKEFLEANKLKSDIIHKIEGSLEKNLNFEEFEENMLLFLKGKIIEKLTTSANDFIYFLQGLNETSFIEIIYILKKYGVNDILYLMNLDENIAIEVKKNMVRYNINKYEIINLREPNVLLNKQIKSPESQQSKFDVSEQKKMIIDRIFFEKMKLIDYSHILILLNFEDIINNIVKEIFYFIFSKIFRPLGRIIELYSKVSNERSLFLLALKKMNAFREKEDWMFVKLEELLIKRMITLQNELVLILNSNNKPFLINGFILARLTESALKESVKKLRGEASYIFNDYVSLELDADKISPISYCVAYDVVKRFETFEALRKKHINTVLKIKRDEKEKEIIQTRAKQKMSTLNWIERRITSTLININKPGFNPSQFYWQEKDTKTATEHIKNHSYLNDNPIELFSYYFNFALEKIKIYAPDIKLLDKEKIDDLVKTITENVIEKRSGQASLGTTSNLLEGDRLEIANKIARRIGKIFDKTLYTKFKQKQKKM
ncbi:MAG: hypothetical protein ACFFAS_14775 [Promethearchaeota archaeon]